MFAPQNAEILIWQMAARGAQLSKLFHHDPSAVNAAGDSHGMRSDRGWTTCEDDDSERSWMSAPAIRLVSHIA